MRNKYEGLAGLGKVGTKAYKAYTSLREATEDREFKLPLNITHRLPEGGVVSLRAWAAAANQPAGPARVGGDQGADDRQGQHT